MPPRARAAISDEDVSRPSRCPRTIPGSHRVHRTAEEGRDVMPEAVGLGEHEVRLVAPAAEEGNARCVGHEAHGQGADIGGQT